MNPNQSIHIQLEDGKGQPLRMRNVLFAIHFFTGGKYRFGFMAGRTDETGESEISYADVEKLRSENAKLFLMDYNTRLEDCDPTVRITIPSERQLRDAVDAASKFKIDSPDWVRDWPQNSKVEAGPQMVELSDPVTNTRIVCKEL